MNYPLVKQNPLLQKKLPSAYGKDGKELAPQFTFDNQQRPVSGYQHTKAF
jgi:hypothetical protein